MLGRVLTLRPPWEDVGVMGPPPRGSKHWGSGGGAPGRRRMEEGCQRLWNVVEVGGSEVVMPHTPWGMVEEVGPPVRRALHWGRNGGAPGRRRRWAGMLGDLRPRKTLQWERGEGRRLCGSRSPVSRAGLRARKRHDVFYSSFSRGSLTFIFKVHIPPI